MIKIDLQPIFNEITTPNSALNLRFSQVVWDEYVTARRINAFHDMQTGIKCNAKIPLGDKGNTYAFMKDKSGLTSQCDFNQCDITTEFSTKTWDTNEYNCEVTICKKDLECDFLDWWNETGCSEVDDLNDKFIQFLVEWMRDAIINSHWTKVWFAFESSTDESLKGTDGLFTQYLGYAPDGDSKRIVIPENAKTTYGDQDNLDPNRGFEVYSAMYSKMLKNRVLRNKRGNLMIMTTEDLAINYQEYLRTHNQVNCCYKQDVTTEVYALDSLNIYGIPIKIVYEWDDIIRGGEFSELDNGTKWDNPHRAVLSWKANQPVGTCNATHLDEVVLLYDQITRKMHIRSEYEIGSKVLLDKQFVLAI